MNTCFINGEYLQEAKISAYDLGFLRGYGVFESFRTYDQEPLFLKQRLDRLNASATQLGITLAYSQEEIKQMIHVLIEENDFDETCFRIIATKGISHDSRYPEGNSSLYVLAQEFTPPPESDYEHGIRAVTTHHSRFLPTIKTLNYLPGLLALEEAKAKGAKETLYCNYQNEILEGATSNFFGIKGTKLITAPHQILHGITREIVLTSTQNDFEIELRNIELEELSELDEAFITSSLKEIMSVIAIDDQIIGDGKVGPHTEIILDLFRSALFELSLN